MPLSRSSRIWKSIVRRASSRRLASDSSLARALASAAIFCSSARWRSSALRSDRLRQGWSLICGVMALARRNGSSSRVEMAK
jgi:hypothetical protein